MNIASKTISSPKQKPLVAIVMATCNGEKFIQEQIESILTQINSILKSNSDPPPTP